MIEPSPLPEYEPDFTVGRGRGCNLCAQKDRDIAALTTALQWAETQLRALVTDDDGSGSFIRGTGTEIAGFGAGMDRIRKALKR